MVDVVISALSKNRLITYNQKVNGTIAEAIHAYESRGVSLHQLLTDYCDVITEPYELMNAVNPWQYIKNKRGESVVCGVSSPEAVFTIAAMSLYKQRPITVIKSIYYLNKERNDTALERVFLNSFQGSIAEDQRVLIVNPSPYVVESIEKSGKNVAYVVIDQTMASLYCKQYKHSEFVSIDDSYRITSADVMIFFTTNIDEKPLHKMLEYVGTVHAKWIYGIIQTRLVDNKESLFWQALSTSRYAIRNIVILPNEMSNSKPIKKCLISIEGGDNAESPHDNPIMRRILTVHKIEYNSTEKTVSLADQSISVRQEELMRCNTLNQLWKKSTAEVVGNDRDDSNNKEEKRKKKINYTNTFPICRTIEYRQRGFHPFWGGRAFA